MEEISIICDNLYLKWGLEMLIREHPISRSGCIFPVIAIVNNKMDVRTKKLLFESQTPLILICNRKLQYVFKYNIKNANAIICCDDMSLNSFRIKLDRIYQNYFKPHKPERPKSNMVITPTEAKVIYFLLNENRDSCIADKLKISIKTVSSHKRNALGKIGVRTLSELVIYKNLLNSVF